MIQFLQKEGGYTSTGLTNEEKRELETLRANIKEYRVKEKHEKGPVIDEYSSEENQSDNDNSDGDNDIDERLDNNDYTKKKMSLLPRPAVSAEVYGEYLKKEDFVPRDILKTDDQMKRIKTRIINSFIFSNLEQKEIEIVIGAMEERKYEAKDTIINQGDSGNVLFVLEEGNLKCYKKFTPNSEPKMVKEYNPGDSFGELALLYNAPRAATVIATTNAITWCLDRETFNNIVKDAAQKKRERYIEVLKKVEILSTIDQYELMQISDAIKSTVYNEGDYIIKEDELGDVFYILEEGECIATKTIEPGKPHQTIMNYHQGEYFGERALIKGEPRYANIIAKTQIVRVISLDRDSFKRLLGPIETLLKRNMEKYESFIMKNNN